MSTKLYSELAGWWTGAILVALTLLAASIHLHGLGENSLWLDEAWVAVSVASPTLRAMIFDFPVQTTPPLLLILIRLLVGVFGSSDFVLRLWPAVAGTVTVPALYFLARRLTGSPHAGLLAASMWAANSTIVHYAQELKQYTTDALVTVVLLLLTERFVEEAPPRRRRVRFAVLTACSVVAVGLSHTSVFVIAVIVARLLFHGWQARETPSRLRNALKVTVAYTVTTLAVFLPSYFIMVRPKTADWLYLFWKDNFPASMSPYDLAAFSVSRSLDFFPFLFEPVWDKLLLGKTPHLALLCSIVGCGLLIVRKRYAALLVLGTPFVLSLTLAVARLYPYGGIRISLYLAPLIFVIVAFGINEMVVQLRRFKLSPTAITLAIVCALPAYAIVAKRVTYSKTHYDMRSLIEDYLRLRQPADTTGVFYATTWAYRHYTGEPDPRGIGKWRDDDLTEARAEIDETIDEMRAGGRLWMIFSMEKRKEVEDLTAYIQRRCERLDLREYENASSYLFRCPSSGEGDDRGQAR